MNLTKTPYLVLFVILIAVGVGTASALITITFEGLAVFKENVQMDKDLNVGGTVTGDGTLGGLSCTPDQVARWNGASWECVTITVDFNQNITVDNAGDVGKYSSIAIRTNGKPVISYYDETNGDLKLVLCHNNSCTSKQISTLDSAGDVGRFTSIAIGTDGKPVISYFDFTNGDLKVVSCGNTTCNFSNNINALDVAGNVGRWTSIAIGSDNLPVISYWDTTNTAFKVLHCGNTTCDSGNTITTVDNSGSVGLFSSIAIGTDGLPVISYNDESIDDLKVLHCGNTLCNSGNTITTLDSAGTVGLHTSIAIGSDGNPVISYYEGFPNDDLKVAHCGNPTCTSGNSKYTIVSGGNIGERSSIAIGTIGNPVISYHDGNTNALKVVHCGNESCSSGNTLTTLDSVDDVGRYSSIVIDPDGNHVISYYDDTNGDLKVASKGVFLTFE